MVRYKLGKMPGKKEAAVRIVKGNNGWFDLEYDGKIRTILTRRIEELVKGED